MGALAGAAIAGERVSALVRHRRDVAAMAVTDVRFMYLHYLG
jgi:hypothetical protein